MIHERRTAQRWLPHVALRDLQSDGAEHALAVACAFAPKLVSHDLCFAIIAADVTRRAPVAEPAPEPPVAKDLLAPPPPAEPPEDQRVLAALCAWSESLRRRNSFLIFSDAELRALARYKLLTITEMQPLLSAEKIERYPTEIIRVVEAATR